MLKRIAFTLMGAFILTGVVYCGSSFPTSTSLETPFPPHPEGERLYNEYCALCHGDRGEGYRADEASALASQDFLIVASDRYIAENTRRGRPGTPMSAWGREYGGPLDERNVSEMVSHLRSWQTEAPIDVSGFTVNGDAERGSTTYAIECETCHGDKGIGARAMTLNHAVFQDTASDGFIQFTVERGRRNTKMPPFAGKLGRRQIRDVVTYVKKIPPDNTASRLFSKKTMGQSTGKQNIVLHPNNQPADFNLKEGRFVKADDVYEAYKNKKSFVFIDARPYSDYLLYHIEDAVSIPFYDVEKHLEEIPKNLWVITYCGCPHAISGRALDVLRAHGYQKSAVLDEGFYVWQKRGYPVVVR